MTASPCPTFPPVAASHRPTAQASAASDEKRERILRVAEALFDRQGYANTTMEQIVSQLGVTKPFVYYYFRGKRDIFETLCWQPTVACFTAMDFPQDDPRPAHAKVVAGLERLIRATLEHHPAAFFAYREPQVYRPEYRAAQRQLARHFYRQMCVLLEAGRASGHLTFNHTRLTAQAACSLPGFLYHWYRPDGPLDADSVVCELTELACRVIGLHAPATPARGDGSTLETP